MDMTAPSRRIRGSSTYQMSAYYVDSRDFAALKSLMESAEVNFSPVIACERFSLDRRFCGLDSKSCRFGIVTFWLDFPTSEFLYTGNDALFGVRFNLFLASID